MKSHITWLFMSLVNMVMLDTADIRFSRFVNPHQAWIGSRLVTCTSDVTLVWSRAQCIARCMTSSSCRSVNLQGTAPLVTCELNTCDDVSLVAMQSDWKFLLPDQCLNCMDTTEPQPTTQYTTMEFLTSSVETSTLVTTESSTTTRTTDSNDPSTTLPSTTEQTTPTTTSSVTSSFVETSTLVTAESSTTTRTTDSNDPSTTVPSTTEQTTPTTTSSVTSSFVETSTLVTTESPTTTMTTESEDPSTTVETTTLFTTESPTTTEAQSTTEQPITCPPTYPAWFSTSTQLCVHYIAVGASGSGNTYCADFNQVTGAYEDLTNKFNGDGNTLKWSLESPSSDSWFQSVELCFRWEYTDDSTQCGGGIAAEVCASLGSYTAEYLDASESNKGGCKMSWKLTAPSGAPAWYQYVQLCMQWTRTGPSNTEQCNGVKQSSGEVCAVPGMWTDFYLDATWHKSKGCDLQWGIKEYCP